MSFIGFPILAALARKPMGSKELRQTLLISRATMNRHLRILIAQNLIIKGADMKYHPRVILRMEHPPEVQPGPVETMPPGAPKGPAIVTPPQVAPETSSEDFHTVPTLANPKPEPKPYKPPKAPEGTGAQALKLSKHFRIPAEIDGQEVAMGAVGGCSCGKPTPLKYGGTPVCAICARG
jgi:hypothetical protein